MTESSKIRISCEIVSVIEKIVKKKPLYGTVRKYIELAILEKIAKEKKK